MAAAATVIDKKGYNKMEDISLGTKSGFKTMLKTIQERTKITM